MMERAKYTQRAQDTEWARGCDACKYGVVASVDMTGVCEFYLERLIQTLRDQIEYCTCRAGVAYKAYMMNRYQILLEEARAYPGPLMQRCANNGTHPDLENAAAKIDGFYSSQMPTIRMEGSPA